LGIKARGKDGTKPNDKRTKNHDGSSGFRIGSMKHLSNLVSLTGKFSSPSLSYQMGVMGLNIQSWKLCSQTLTLGGHGNERMRAVFVWVDNLFLIKEHIHFLFSSPDLSARAKLNSCAWRIFKRQKTET
jgi:hypothetical protein